MALTAEAIQQLGNASLIDFFNTNRSIYLAKAKTAYGYAKVYVEASGQHVRVDDVASPLVLALKVGDPLASYLAKKKLTQKYWYDRFADYVLDQVWKELTQ